MSIAQKVGKAGILMLLKKGWGAIVSFAVMAYLARVLDKSDFGVVAISATLISFIQVITVSGISEYIIIYNGKNKRNIYNAAFWLNFFLTLFVSFIVIIFAPLWARFYNDNRILNIIYLLTFSFFFNMLASIPISIYRKEIDYKPIIVIQTIFATIANILKVLLAYLGFGVYSLAIPNAIIAPAIAVLLYWKSGFKPQKTIGIRYWKQIVHFTKFVLGQRVFNKIVNEGDSLIIGKFFGMTTLGIYNLAFQFAHLFPRNFLPIVSNISVPYLSKYNTDKELISRQYYKMIRLVTYISIPVITLLIINANLLIPFIYGKKWIDAVLIFQILSISIIFKMISSPSSSMFYVMKKPKIGFYFTMIFSLIFISLLLLSTSLKNIIITVIIISTTRILGSLISINLSLSLINKKIFFIFKFIFPNLLISLLVIFILFFQKFHTIILNFIYVTSWILINFSFLKEDTLGVIEDIKKLNPIKK